MLKFKPFDENANRSGRRHPVPHNMKLGQTVCRAQPVPKNTRIQLHYKMVRATKLGMSFSVAEDSKVFAIRRDK